MVIITTYIITLSKLLPASLSTWQLLEMFNYTDIYN